MVERGDITGAVSLSVLTQAWMGLAGPLTIVVIARILHPATQGFYYTFGSVLALQVFFELGLATVIVQMASHEWAHLHRRPDGLIEGASEARSRLAGLGRFSLCWYAVAGALFVAILLLGGGHFFADKAAESAVVWRGPWNCLVIVVGMQLLLQPLFSLIEGCNQLTSLYGIRFAQAVGTSVGLIVAMLLGAGLYSLAAGAFLRLLIGLWWLAFPQRAFVRIALSERLSSRIDWAREVWPFQWRIAVSWLAGYIIFSLITPVMFQFHGPIVAGQMGMSLALVGAIENFAGAWINTRGPRFGVLIAHRDFSALDQLFRRSLRIALLVALVGSMVVLLVVLVLQVSVPLYAARFLPLFPLGLLISCRVLQIPVTGMGVYLRAHKKEPLMGVSVSSAVLAGSAVWLLGRTWGPAGALAGSLAVTVAWTLPSSYFVFRRCRAEWHQPTDPVQLLSL